jgi:hypothetical protein
MKLSAVFSKLSSILNTLNYFPRRRKEKLYEQWVQRADLPPEAIPREKVREDIRPKKEKESLQQPILYILLGASLVIFCVGFVLLIVESC